jgi:hypothetical protein
MINSQDGGMLERMLTDWKRSNLIEQKTQENRYQISFFVLFLVIWQLLEVFDISDLVSALRNGWGSCTSV